MVIRWIMRAEVKKINRLGSNCKDSEKRPDNESSEPSVCVS